MIQCKGCGFSVNELMRFALMKNICPSCGAGLLSSKDSNIISYIGSRIASQRFASSLTETQVYDISLFIFNELHDGFGKIVNEIRKKTVATTEEFGDEISHSEGEAEYESDESDDLSSIRKQVAAEFGSDEEDDSEESEMNEDALSKAERLKRLHQQRVSSNPNLIEGIPVTIKRGGFKGVSRSG
jgi:hypothetical protein